MDLRLVDRGFLALTGFAVLLIVAMLAVIIGNIVLHGWERVTWEFITAAPRVGMTEGGVDDHPRRLVHHQKELVLIKDLEGDGLGLQQRLPDLGKLDDDLIAATGNEARSGDRHAAHANLSRRDEALNPAAR